MAADQALLDGAEYRLIGFDVDVDVLEPADLLPVTVDQMLALPFADVLVLGPCVAFSFPAAPSLPASLAPPALRRRLLIDAVRTGARGGLLRSNRSRSRIG